MHKELSEAYNEELRFLRDVGAEFAQAYPQTAHALGLEADRASDPFVERLLEGVAFLTAKTACRMKHEQERIAQDLLQVTMPDLICQLPPAAMVELTPLTNLSKGPHQRVPKGSRFRYTSEKHQELSYITTADVDLAPIEIRSSEHIEPEHAMALLDQARQRFGLDLRESPRMVRVKLASMAGQSLREVLPQQLRMFCAGPAGALLWQALTQQCNAILFVDPQYQTLLASHTQGHCEAAGWSEEESLLPADCVIPGPYRLLREWNYWPDRFLFAELTGLAAQLQGYNGSELDILFCIDINTRLPYRFPEKSLKLFCVPLVNLKKVICEPLTLTPTEHEYTLRLPSRQIDNRIVCVDRVEYRGDDGHWQTILPVCALGAAPLAHKSEPAYVIRRQARWRRATRRSEPVQTTEWRIAPSISVALQPASAPVVSVHVWVSHLQAEHIVVDQVNGWHLDCPLPVRQIAGLTTPASSSPTVKEPSAMLALASFRVDVLTQLDPQAMAEKIKQWLLLLGPCGFANTLRSVEMQRCARHSPWLGKRVLAQGWKLKLETDAESASSPFLPLWARVLASTLCRQLQSESFAECVFTYAKTEVATSRVWR